MKLSTLTHFDEQDIYFLFGMEILISNKKLSIAKPVIGHKKIFYFASLMILKSIKFSI
ncbi:hypothetical protein EfsSVR2330_03730 [Enterococcus faecalis]|nr:hypothetical protein EfsSVR2330_03730 [Enterococcus faecalis]